MKTRRPRTKNDSEIVMRGLTIVIMWGAVIVLLLCILLEMLYAWLGGG